MPIISTLRFVERCLASSVAKAMEDKCEADSVGAVEAFSLPPSLGFDATGVSPGPPSRGRPFAGFWSLRFAMFRFSNLRGYSVGLALQGWRPLRPRKRGKAPRVATPS